MNFQEFLRHEELRHRSLGANRSDQDPRHRASYLHEGTLVSYVIVCLADATST